jgi:hypothetical protein
MTINPAERAFPDPSALVAYEDGLLFVQAFLNTFAHGDLKPWAAKFEPPLNYTLLISIRNGKAAKATPRVVQKLLAVCGYNTTLINNRLTAAEYGNYFQFHDLEKLTEFHEQLKIIKR